LKALFPAAAAGLAPMSDHPKKVVQRSGADLFDEEAT